MKSMFVSSLKYLSLSQFCVKQELYDLIEYLVLLLLYMMTIFITIGFYLNNFTFLEIQSQISHILPPRLNNFFFILLTFRPDRYKPRLAVGYFDQKR